MLLSNFFLIKEIKILQTNKKEDPNQKLSINSQVTYASLTCLKNIHLSQPESQQSKPHFVGKRKRSNSKPYSRESPAVLANTCRTNDQSKMSASATLSPHPQLVASCFSFSTAQPLFFIPLSQVVST